MIRSNLQSDALKYRDGTSQNKRVLPMLNPKYIDVDERTVEDLLRFAQEFASTVYFYNSSNVLTVDGRTHGWIPMLIEDIKPYAINATESGKTILKEEWREKIIEYIENPESFINDRTAFQKLSKPQLSLLIAFFQLLQNIKNQLNEFTYQHLEFYYKEALGMAPKLPVSDQVNVIINLIDSTDQYFLEAGTLLDAGKDSDGVQRLYKTDQNILVNKAQIGSLKTIFVEKQLIGIEEAHQNNTDDVDKGLVKMIELALGDLGPGEDLPDFPEAVINLNLATDQLRLIHIYDNIDDVDNLAYITDKLFMTQGDFSYIIEKHQQDLDNEQENVTEDEWNLIYGILANSYKLKQEYERRVALKAIVDATPDDIESGFLKMLELALGDPDPEDSLADYPSGATSLDDIYSWLTGNDADAAALALAYVNDELFLVEADFGTIMTVKNNENATDEDWENVYVIVENAQRKKRIIDIPTPQKEEWYNIFAAPDATQITVESTYEKDESHLRWETFGSAPATHTEDLLEKAQVGFAMTSPILLLEEGIRVITLTLDYEESSFDIAKIEKTLFTYDYLTEPDKNPFAFLFSTDGGWVEPDSVTVNYGICFTNIPSDDEAYTADIDTDEMIVTKDSGEDFVLEDEGNFIIWDDGTIYRITIFENATTVRVETYSQISEHTGIKKYDSSYIYFNGFQFVITIGEDKEAIKAYNVPEDTTQIDSVWPQMKMLMKERGDDDDVNSYQYLKDLVVEKAYIYVDVQGIRTFQVQSDRGILDSKKPFELFGTAPETGGSFYFAHPEMAYKKLEDMKVQIEWMGIPETYFKNYYATYWKISEIDSDIGPYHYLNESDEPVYVDYYYDEDSQARVYHEVGNIVSIVEPEEKTLINTEGWKIRENADLSGHLKIFDNRLHLTVSEDISLFDAEDAAAIHTISLTDVPDMLAVYYPTYPYDRDPDIVTNSNILNWDRYFRLELNTPDFQHANYSLTYTKQSLLINNSEIPEAELTALQALLINPPYTPKVKEMKLGYTSSGEFFPAGATGYDHFYHLHPFGYCEILPDSLTGNYSFLPQYPNEGELFIGLSDLDGDELSVLFQMAEGSANPDLVQPDLSWCYLSGNQWLELDKGNMSSDTTSGLLNTGIISFSIPEGANDDNTLLPGGMRWIKAAVNENSSAISDVIDIRTQALSATFMDQGNAADHFDKPLPAETITGTISKIPEIDNIVQPYTSAKGRQAENDDQFYMRVSEVLRHKNRALTMWDYERLLLQNFPGIHKIKCLSANLIDPSEPPGSVHIVPIPDIRGKLPFNPFEPKVSANTISAIQDFIEEHTAPSVTFTVKNPTYIQLKTRFAVSFKKGYNADYHKNMLNEELKRYLAPWAYDEGADIVFGGKLYANVIVNFLEERPYVDFVAKVKLFQSDDGIDFIDVRAVNGTGRNEAYSDNPDVIWVSAMHHEIDIIAEGGYEDEKYGGIEYMKIELDFIVADEEGNQA